MLYSQRWRQGVRERQTGSERKTDRDKGNGGCGPSCILEEDTNDLHVLQCLVERSGSPMSS